jgi:hypothetical protein
MARMTLTTEHDGPSKRRAIRVDPTFATHRASAPCPQAASKQTNFPSRNRLQRLGASQGRVAPLLAPPECHRLLTGRPPAARSDRSGLPCRLVPGVIPKGAISRASAAAVIGLPLRHSDQGRFSNAPRSSASTAEGSRSTPGRAAKISRISPTSPFRFAMGRGVRSRPRWEDPRGGLGLVPRADINR